MKTFADQANRALLLMLLLVVSSAKAGAVTTGGGRMTSVLTHADKQGHVETVAEMDKDAILQKGMLQGVPSFTGSRRLMMMGMPSSSTGSGSKSAYYSGGGGGNYGWYSGQSAATENSATDKKGHGPAPLARNLTLAVVGVALVVLAATAAWMEKRKRRDALKAAAILGSSGSHDSSTIMTADSNHRHCGLDSPYII